MLLFGSKLLAAKKAAEDGPQDEQDSGMGSSLIGAQKDAINTLSKHEKLLMLELQRTRLNIVQELQELDPQLSTGSWREVQSAIEQYQHKITNLAAEDTVDGQRVAGKFSLGGPPHGGSPPHHGHTMADSGGADAYKSVTNAKRTKLVNTAAQIPISRLRTGVDMLPVLSSVGLNDVELQIKRQRPLRMPVFKLPEIDPQRVMEVMEDASGVPNVLKEKLVVERKSTTPSAKARKRFRNADDYTASLLGQLRALSPMDIAYVLELNRMTHEEWGQVSDELEERVRRKVSCDTSDIADEGTPSVFARARAAHLQGMQTGGGGFPQAGFPDQGSTLTMGSTATKRGTPLGRSLMSSGQGPGQLEGGGTDALSLFSGHTRQSQTSSKAKSTRGVKDKIKESMQRSQSTSDMLKEELLGSLRNMQHHTVGVKSNIAAIQSLVHIDNPRARQMMYSVAAERMQGALKLLVAGELRRGWRAWRLVNGQLRRRMCTILTIKLLGMRIISQKLNTAVCRVVEKKFLKWVNYTQKESARIKRELQLQATTEIQRHMRAFLARKRVRYLKEQIKYRRLYAAVIKIQAQIRGRLVHWKFVKFMRGRLEDRSALKLQRRYRGYRGRKRVKIIRFQKNKVRAAIMIQSVVRGRAGRNRYHHKNKDRLRMRAAVKIESLVRGFLTRRSIARILEKKNQDAAVLIIQAQWRGGICRMSMDRKRKEIEEYKQTRFRAVRDIQRTFRGWRSRLSTRIKFIEAERKNRKLGVAATVINNIVRRFIARAFVRDLRKEKMRELLEDARTWKEMWSEDSEAWFYLNGVTGEDLWQPPTTGYTKNDGTLVLATGAIIEDPAVTEANELERKKNSETLCCECEERAAIKYCNQCGDKYCTPCFRTSHSTGTRRNHVPEALGPIDCSECELVLCVRWCVSCDEAYCDGCWRKVHSRGKRRFHPFCEVTSKGRIDPRQLTMDGSQVEGHDPTYAQQMVDAEEHQGEYDAANAEFQQYSAEQQDAAAQWETYQDDQGNDYYYNTTTGETTYDYPF